MPWSLWYQGMYVPSLRRPAVEVHLKVAVINDGRKNHVIIPQLIDELRKADYKFTVPDFESTWENFCPCEEAPMHTDATLLDGLKQAGLISYTATYIRLYDLGNTATLLCSLGGAKIGSKSAVGQATECLYALASVKVPIEADVFQRERDLFYPIHLGVPDGEPKVSAGLVAHLLAMCGPASILLLLTSLLIVLTGRR